MINHVYTLLLNRASADIVEPLLLIDTDYMPVRLTGPLLTVETALYAGCITGADREYRASLLLGIVTTPELLPYAEGFDPRTTYRSRNMSVLDMCVAETRQPAMTDDTVESITKALRGVPGLFVSATHTATLEALRLAYYSAPDKYISLGAGVLAYLYRIDNVRARR